MPIQPAMNDEKESMRGAMRPTSAKPATVFAPATSHSRREEVSAERTAGTGAAGFPDRRPAEWSAPVLFLRPAEPSATGSVVRRPAEPSAKKGAGFIPGQRKNQAAKRRGVCPTGAGRVRRPTSHLRPKYTAK